MILFFIDPAYTNITIKDKKVFLLLINENKI